MLRGGHKKEKKNVLSEPSQRLVTMGFPPIHLEVEPPPSPLDPSQMLLLGSSFPSPQVPPVFPVYSPTIQMSLT